MLARYFCMRFLLRYCCVLLLVATALLPALPVLAQRNSAKTFREAPALRGTLLAGGVRYGISNPEMIVGPGVEEVLASPDGRIVLAARVVREITPAVIASGKAEDAPGEASIVSWNSRNGRLRVVWERPLAAGEELLFRLRGWMGNTGTAVGYVPTPRNKGGQPANSSGMSFLLIDAATGRAREMPVPPNTYSFVKPSPSLPVAALFGADGACDEEIQFLRPDGTLTPACRLAGPTFFTRWSLDGKELWGVSGGKTETWYAVDPIALSVRVIDAPPKNKKGKTDYGDEDCFSTSLPLQLEGESGSDKPGRVWLRPADGDGSSVLLAAEGEPVGLLPGGSAALFRSAGALYVVRIIAAPAK